MFERFRFNRMELAGSLGDLGVLLPIAIAMVLFNGLDPLGLFLSIGVFYILSGVYFGITVPVQPMKVIGAYAIATAMSADQILASSLLMGAFLLLIGITGAIDLIRRITPKAVIRGVQLSTGALLIAGGVKFMIGTSSFQVLQKAAEPHLAVQSIGPIPVGLLIGILGGIVTLLLLDSRRFPAGLVVVAGGFAVGLALGARMPPEGLGLHLPRWLPFGFPSEADFTGAQPAAHGDPGHLAGLRRHPVGRHHHGPGPAQGLFRGHPDFGHHPGKQPCRRLHRRDAGGLDVEMGEAFRLEIGACR